jgi:hypothetical protein
LSLTVLTRRSLRVHLNIPHPSVLAITSPEECDVEKATEAEINCYLMDSELAAGPQVSTARA